MNPVAFQIGPIAIHWYGILIVTGILAAVYLSTYTAKLYDEDPQLVWDSLVWVVLLGVVGARIYHVLTVPPSMGVDRWYYLRHPLEILATWKGGLGIYGAVLGGAVGLYIVVRRAKRNMWRWLDIVAPGVALAQAIGRWGNWINQELYGRPTDLPWAIYIEPQFRLAGYESYERFHPIFFYESVWNLATAAILVYLIRRYRTKLVPGLVAGIYFISYSTIRFLLEFVRLDRPAIGGISIAQVVALVVILVWSGLIFLRIKAYRPAPHLDAAKRETAHASPPPSPEA
jgi:phosphatidylglycerol:prolipoprotein diacylglycerol transferase